MNFVTRKHISRRTMLRGMGAAIALPALDAMFPALAAAPAAGAPSGGGVCSQRHHHEGLEARGHRRRILPSRGYSSRWSRSARTSPCFRAWPTMRRKRRSGGGHAKATGSFLSGAQPKYTAGPDVHAGVTFDQMVAQHWGSETRVPSLQLGCEDSRMVGNCDTGSSCAYTNTLSWKNADTPLAGGGESAIRLRAAVRRRSTPAFPPMSAPAAPSTEGAFWTTPARMRSA